MLRQEITKITFDKSLISIGELIIKKRVDRDLDDKIIEIEELQFEITNISNQAIKDIEIDLNYYNSVHKFVGNDSDVRFNPLLAGEKHICKCFIEAPLGTEKSELTITCEKYGMREKIGEFIYKPWLIGLIFILIIAMKFYKK